MKVPCVVRAGYNGAIFKSLYDMSSGLIDNVPSDLFSYIPPKYVRDMFGNVGDISFSSVSLEASLRRLLTAPGVTCVFTDYGKHTYAINDKVIEIQSTATMGDNVLQHETPLVAFSSNCFNVGFYRQPIVSYVAPMINVQRMLVYKLSDGSVVFWDGEKFAPLMCLCDTKPNYSLIDYSAFIKNPDMSIVGVSTYNNQQVFIRRE